MIDAESHLKVARRLRTTIGIIGGILLLVFGLITVLGIATGDMGDEFLIFLLCLISLPVVFGPAYAVCGIWELQAARMMPAPGVSPQPTQEG
ncbi:hypothetical protein [Corynebacterium lizhenjunii]|uniref:hypothetical protein n=1 Tax=Corynebacterium lizhenjunii TaxID=2709394 RepID=UPI0013E9FEF4|nr:hypothetical protein [Corynebacterium lizhenjunii]